MRTTQRLKNSGDISIFQLNNNNQHQSKSEAVVFQIPLLHKRFGRQLQIEMKTLLFILVIFLSHRTCAQSENLDSLIGCIDNKQVIDDRDYIGPIITLQGECLKTTSNRETGDK